MSIYTPFRLTKRVNAMRLSNQPHNNGSTFIFLLKPLNAWARVIFHILTQLTSLQKPELTII